MDIKSYRDLKVWQRAHHHTLFVYRISSAFPSEESYGLTSQLRRASSSIGLNIVEGKNRNTTKEFRHFLYMARGSNEELHYLLLLTKDLGYLDENSYLEATMKCEEVGKMLNGLIKSLNITDH